jgi:hypothetical protein
MHGLQSKQIKDSAIARLDAWTHVFMSLICTYFSCPLNIVKKTLSDV